MNQAIQQDPSNVAVHNNLGEAYRALNRLDDAVRCYRGAIALRPEYANAHNNLGVALSKQGKFEDAVDSFRKALALKPDLATARTNLFKALGKAYLQRGQHANGLEMILRSTGFIRFKSNSEIRLILGTENETN